MAFRWIHPLMIINNTMKRGLVTVTVLMVSFLAASAQSIWDKAHLARVRESLGRPAYAVAYRQLLDDADKKLAAEPVSVMMKEKTPASGDKHDYMSLSRYFWPDPSKPDGLPYISRDGVSNPELERYDRNRLSTMADGVTTLSLAWYFSSDEKYARKAVEYLKVWFLNKETRMNPNLNYAQVVPGMFNDRGRCYGVIDTYSFVEMLEAVQLLQQSPAFSRKDQKALKVWFARLLEWFLTSKQGMEEGEQRNNHSVAYDVQVIAFACYVGNRQVAEQYVRDFPEKRIFQQIQPDGRQPQQLRRTLAFGYSQYNLSHMIDVFRMAHHMGIRIDDATSAEGAGFYKAMDFLLPYVGVSVDRWPYQQISEWDYKQNEFCKDLYRAWVLNPLRTDYLDVAKSHLRMNWSDRFFLLYYEPDESDDAFASADVQLRYQLECVKEARKKVADKQKMMPRSVEKDGSLRLVGENDWCSGFFPGMLWLMYEYSHDRFWREQAVSYTWLIENVKYHTGTHDLGFMMGCSFGNGWRLTHEESFRDVLLRSAESLATRFNEKVGCICSWSWGTPDRWKYAVIIDNMMNLELLFEASRLTGDKRYHEMAVSHATKTMENHFRDDYSSYHVVDYDPETGKVIKRITHQGYADESVWSRGQAWGLYGFTMCYRYTRNEAFLQQARHIARFFFSQQDLPADKIPYWDMRDPGIETARQTAATAEVPRDASAAAIFASALYELAGYVQPDEARGYVSLADQILHSLQQNYQPQPQTAQGFLLLHSTGNHPAGDEIDVPINYADYYYLEALLRRKAFRSLRP